MIHTDEFRIVLDLNYCNEYEDILTISTIHYPINLAYLNEYFTTAELFNLFADTLLNHSIDIQLPSLAIVAKFLDERFVDEEAAAFDLEMVINSMKHSAQVYDNLAHYLFNQMIKAHDSETKFDLLSPFTWVTIFSWVTSITALASVAMLRIKVRSLTLMMAVRAARAVQAVPRVISMTQAITTTESPLDLLEEWTKHVGHITELVPIEIILLCLLMWFVFKVARILYVARRADTARTRLALEIGNGTDMVLLHVIAFPHASRYYRLVINRSEVGFLLTETNLMAKLAWNRGVSLYSSTLDTPIPLPTALTVPPWKVKLLNSILQGHYYALVQRVTDRDMEIVTLRDPRYAIVTQPLYPPLV